MFHLAVIGGGPAGYMAAITAAAPGGIRAAAPAAAGSPGAAGAPAVTIFDAGVPLSRLLRTGGGRCNLANEMTDKQELAAQYPRGGKFLFSAFARFGPREVMSWFASRGCLLQTEEDGRVFPRSERAEEVRTLLVDQARQRGITVRAQTAATALERAGSGFAVATAGGTERFDKVIIAAGGAGSEGEESGYALARGLGHSITPLAPSLAALVTREIWPGSLAGLTVRQARLSARFAGKKVAVETGDMLFTHRGISGPLAFRISSRSAFLDISAAAPLLLQLSVLPDRKASEIQAALLAALTRSPHQRVAEAVRQLVPRSLAEAIVTLAGLDPLMPCSHLGREDRKVIEGLVDRLPLTVIDREKGTEMVTAGGVVLSEIDPRTMESRLVPGLFFCGEILDIDGFTGGFNLLAAWSTGHCAGLAASS